jgi:hypothetical protein
MPQSDRNPQRENKPRGNEPGFNWRGVILVAIAFGFFGLALLFYRGGYQSYEEVPLNRFYDLLAQKQVVNDKNSPLLLVIESDKQTQMLRGTYIKQAAGGAPAQQVPFHTTVYSISPSPPIFSKNCTTPEWGTPPSSPIRIFSATP